MPLNTTKPVFFLTAVIFLQIFIVVFNSCKKVHTTTSNRISRDTINTINITGRLVNDLGKPFSNIGYLFVPSPIPGPTVTGITDSLGNIKNIIAKNTNYMLYVFASDYCDPIYSQAFVTVNTDISLGAIVVPVMSFIATGTVVDCNNNIVRTGKVFLQLFQKDSSSSISADGKFNFVLPTCNRTDSIPVVIWVADSNGFQTGNRFFYSLHSGNNDIGIVSGCYRDSVSNEFINYSVDSSHYSFASPVDPFSEWVEPGSGFMYIGGGNFMFSGTGQGVYFVLTRSLGVASADVSIAEFEIFPDYGMYGTVSTPKPVVNMSEYGPVGGYIAGNITLEVEDIQDHSVHNATCNFRVKRRE